jgi:hypothetical protein
MSLDCPLGYSHCSKSVRSLACFRWVLRSPFSQASVVPSSTISRSMCTTRNIARGCLEMRTLTSGRRRTSRPLLLRRSLRKLPRTRRPPCRAWTRQLKSLRNEVIQAGRRHRKHHSRVPRMGCQLPRPRVGATRAEVPRAAKPPAHATLTRSIQVCRAWRHLT